MFTHKVEYHEKITLSTACMKRRKCLLKSEKLFWCTENSPFYIGHKNVSLFLVKLCEQIQNVCTPSILKYVACNFLEMSNLTNFDQENITKIIDTKCI
jgi:hypothetical protein